MGKHCGTKNLLVVVTDPWYPSMHSVGLVCPVDFPVTADGLSELGTPAREGHTDATHVCTFCQTAWYDPPTPTHEGENVFPLVLTDPWNPSSHTTFTELPVTLPETALGVLLFATPARGLHTVG